MRTDEFNGTSLGSHWTTTDARGDSTFSVSDGKLQISVPAGTEHDPWTYLWPPHATQSHDNSNFDVYAKFTAMPGDTTGSAYKVHGIVAKQDMNDFVRADFVSNPSGASGTNRLFVATCANGSMTNRLDTYVDDTHVYLRVARSGNTFTVYTSANGSSWSQRVQFTFTLTVNEVGVFVGNATGSSSPAYSASIDLFSVSGSYVLDCSKGSFTYTGNAATLTRGWSMVASLGTFSLTGRSASLLRTLKLTPQIGAYTFTGNAVNPVSNRKFGASAGQYTLAGTAANTWYNRSISSVAGAFSFTGMASTLARGRTVTALHGVFALQGVDTTLLRGRMALVGTGALVLDGQVVNLSISRSVIALHGAYGANGVSSGLFAFRRADLDGGAIILTGYDADLTLSGSFLLSAEHGTLLLDAQATNLLADRHTLAGFGQFNLTGMDVRVLAGRLLSADVAALILDGKVVVFQTSNLSLVSLQGEQFLKGKIFMPSLAIAESGAILSTPDAVGEAIRKSRLSNTKLVN